MSIFKNMLSSSETLFKNENALDYDFIPKLIPFRENQQREIALAISPLLNERSGRNLVIHGTPGVGKTVAIKHILRDLEDETDSVFQIYINCWQKNTSFKIIQEACHQLNYKLTHNKKTDELMKILASMINKKSVVIVLDEIDKVEETNFLYSFLEDFFRKTIILITNYKTWLETLDDRIKSRLSPKLIDFNSYSLAETLEILKQRCNYAFFENVVSKDVIDKIAEKAFELKDVRTGIYLLKQAGLSAETRASRRIELKDAEKAMSNMEEFSIKNKAELQGEENLLLEIIKDNSGLTMGELFDKYKEKGGKGVYKTFQRLIEKLDSNNFIFTKKENRGNKGNTKIIEYDSTKKLSDFS